MWGLEELHIVCQNPKCYIYKSSRQITKKNQKVFKWSENTACVKVISINYFGKSTVLHLQ